MCSLLYNAGYIICCYYGYLSSVVIYTTAYLCQSLPVAKFYFLYYTVVNLFQHDG